MHSIAIILLGVALAKAQESTSIVLTDGITTTMILPAWPTSGAGESIEESPAISSYISEDISSIISEVTSDAESATSSLLSEGESATSATDSEITTMADSLTSMIEDNTSTNIDATTLAPTVSMNGTETTTAPTVVVTAAANQIEQSVAGLLGFSLFGFFWI